jgi:hypothetical protein
VTANLPPVWVGSAASLNGALARDSTPSIRPRHRTGPREVPPGTSGISYGTAHQAATQRPIRRRPDHRTCHLRGALFGPSTKISRARNRVLAFCFLLPPSSTIPWLQNSGRKWLPPQLLRSRSRAPLVTRSSCSTPSYFAIAIL